MGKNIILDQIENTVNLLYQNKEKDGIAEVTKLISQFQNIIQNMTESQLDSVGNFSLLMMRDLVAISEKQDVLGMADCLAEKAMIFVQFISQT